MADKRKPADEDLVENDLCDLDPGKICDNCCKCLEKNDADYMDISASLDLESMRVYYADADEPDDFAEDLPPLDIDPKLLAEWEEKLRQMELGERNAKENGGGGEEEAPFIKHDAARMRASRKRRERIREKPEN